MTEKKYVVVGGGGFGREVACWLLDVIDANRQGRIIGFIDDEPKDASAFPGEISYLGSIERYQPQADHELLVAIGTPRHKQIVVEKLKERGAHIGSLLHPTAVVARTAKLGQGVVVCPGAVISANAVVGDFVAVNICSSVGHDVKIGAHCTLSSHVDLTGGVVLEAAVMVGSGARVLPGVRIGEGATIGAGAIVMRNTLAGVTMYALPAKRL